VQLFMETLLPTILGTFDVAHSPLKSCTGEERSQLWSCSGPKSVDAPDTALKRRIPHRGCPASAMRLRQQANDGGCSQANDGDFSQAPSTQSSVSSASSVVSSAGGARSGVDEQEPRYYICKVESWFHAIDVQRAGCVNFRQLMAALRRDPGLQAMLCKATGVKFDESEQHAHSRLKLAGLLAIPAHERSALLGEERRRIKEVFQCFGTDTTKGMLDMPMFLNIFHQCGLIFEPEYHC